MSVVEPEGDSNAKLSGMQAPLTKTHARPLVMLCVCLSAGGTLPEDTDCVLFPVPPVPIVL